MNTKTLSLTITISAAYVIVTILFAPLSFMMVQVRFSEMLAPIPFYLGVPGIVGLSIGCFIANCFSPYGLLDVIIGTLGTFLGALGSHYSRNLFVACLCPVISNTILVSYLLHIYGLNFWQSIFFVGWGQLISCIFLGYPFMKLLRKIYPEIDIKTKKRN